MSRNHFEIKRNEHLNVTPREGRVSRNMKADDDLKDTLVTPREGRVSRNAYIQLCLAMSASRPARGV